MRRTIIIACIWWLGACGAREVLVFGMTRDEVAQVVETPLIYVSGRRGSERYLVQQPSAVPGIHPVDERITLQFRQGRLTGWKREWLMRPTWW